MSLVLAVDTSPQMSSQCAFCINQDTQAGGKDHNRPFDYAHCRFANPIVIALRSKTATRLCMKVSPRM